MKSSLLQSRKFWLMILDVIVSLVTYFVTKYAAPEMTKDILFLLTALQPVVIALIASITVQNVQHIKNKAFAEVEIAVTKPTAETQDTPQ